MDDYTRRGANTKTKIDARKETNSKNKRYQGEDRQAVDDYTRMGAKKKNTRQKGD